MVAVVGVLVVLAGLVTRYEERVERSENVAAPLLTAVVGIGPDGTRIPIPPGTDPSVVEFYPGTRVLTPDSAAVLTRTTVTAKDAAKSAALAAEQRAWIESGTIPGAGGPYQDMVTDALLDIHTLLQDNGASLAAWPGAWRYVWPRDAAFVAVALTKTGHPGDALRILEFLQRQQPSDGIFEARYRPDETGVPDARGKQSDGIGWVLWATLRLVQSLPAKEGDAALEALRPMIDASTDAALRLTDSTDALPPVSEDYWEVPMYRLSLGTAAPIALGLRSAASLQSMLGARTTARSTARRAVRLEKSITSDYGAHGYPRELGGDASDASISFLLPPFTDKAAPSVVAAWRKAGRQMVRPAGGLAPGAGWRNDGVSWSPQTALFALTGASIGDTGAAEWWMTWLSDHRTAYGSIPEKVLSTGAPAGPAPLAWPDALVILTAARL
jgi:GH15 family glucan-1,4-alpha-glucosidase